MISINHQCTIQNNYLSIWYELGPIASSPGEAKRPGVGHGGGIMLGKTHQSMNTDLVSHTTALEFSLFFVPIRTLL
jgi:hypothetical protein